MNGVKNAREALFREDGPGAPRNARTGPATAGFLLFMPGPLPICRNCRSMLSNPELRGTSPKVPCFARGGKETTMREHTPTS